MRSNATEICSHSIFPWGTHKVHLHVRYEQIIYSSNKLVFSHQVRVALEVLQEFQQQDYLLQLLRVLWCCRRPLERNDSIFYDGFCSWPVACDFCSLFWWYQVTGSKKGWYSTPNTVQEQCGTNYAVSCEIAIIKVKLCGVSMQARMWKRMRRDLWKKLAS